MQGMQAEQLTRQFTRRAGFWVRSVAWLVDTCFTSAATLAVTAAVMVQTDATSDGPGPFSGRLLRIVVPALTLAYSSFEVFKGATPGKMLLGLVIATPRGGAADRWTLALRWSSKQAPLLLTLTHGITRDVLSQFLAGLMNSVVFVGCLQALDEDKRAWHDEWAGTAVFHRPRGAGAGGPAGAPAGPPPLPQGSARSGR
jgi:uncharacterized RDD family membrane protein YckC